MEARSSRSAKKYLIFFLIMAIAIGGFLISRLDDLNIAKSYSAKYLCSTIFVSGQDETLVKERFVAPKVNPLPLLWEVDVDYNKQQVIVRDKLGLSDRRYGRAAFRAGTGCTVAINKTLAAVQREKIKLLDPPQLDARLSWPKGSAGIGQQRFAGIDYPALQQAIEEAFVEPESGPRNTSSVLVAYKGQLIAEAYGQGITAASPVLGWSMTKSITGILVGLMVDQGKLSLNAPAPIAAWENTDKAVITNKQLLQMSSGLKFIERYTRESNATRMLTMESNQFEYVAALPLQHEPDTEFHYSTGTSVLLGSILRDASGGSEQSLYNFAQQQLFHPLGIQNAVIEFDESGNWSAGSFSLLKPRDWLRLGQLLLQQGKWQDQQLLSKSWVDFMRSESATNPNYGGHIWLNNGQKKFPDLPANSFYFSGHQSQFLIVIPDLELIILRTGVTEKFRNSGVKELATAVYRAVKP